MLMNTNTLYFRAALTIAAIWIAVFAYLSYSGYREAYQSVEYVRYGVPEELTDECFFSVLDWSRESVQSRKPTNEETQSCLRRAGDAHERSITSSNQFVFEQAWKNFVFKGVLPPLALIGIAAFWTIIAGGMTRTGSGYLNWLRFGSRMPIDQSKNDEA